MCVCVCKSIYVDFIHSVKQFAHHFQNPSPKSHSIDLKHAPAADSSKHARGVRYAQPQEIDPEQGKSLSKRIGWITNAPGPAQKRIGTNTFFSSREAHLQNLREMPGT